MRLHSLAALGCAASLTLSFTALADSSAEHSFAAGARAPATENAAWQGKDLDHDGANWADHSHGLLGHNERHFEHISAVPEPGSWVLLAAGLPMVGWIAARRGKSRRR